MGIWTTSCGSSGCRATAQVDVPGGDLSDKQIDDFITEGVKKFGWIIHQVGIGPFAEKSRFCSTECLEEDLRHERLHRPLNYLAWLKIYGLDPWDLDASRDGLGEIEERHRPAARHLVEWVSQHEPEVRNIAAEFARWELRCVHGVDCDEPGALREFQSDHDPANLPERALRAISGADSQATMTFLVWRAMREEKPLFCLLGPEQGQSRSRRRHRVWHWSDYGVVCPSLWVTRGDPDLAAELVCRAAADGLDVDADGELEPDTSSPEALGAQFRQIGAGS
jgi:hypothetical protein